MADTYLVMLLFASEIGAAAWGRIVQCASRREAGRVLGTTMAFFLLDWALLAALPILGLSYGPVITSLAGISAVRMLVLLTLLTIMGLWKLLRGKRPAGNPNVQRAGFGLLILWALNLGVLLGEIDGLYVEPFSLRLSEVNVPGPILAPGKALRILHLSDLHVERFGPRERKLLQMVADLQPDLIVLTGDYLNIDYNDDPETMRDTRAVLASLSAPYGVYAVSGSPPVDTPDALEAIFNGLSITLLQDEIHSLTLEGGVLYILGISNLGYTRDRVVLQKLMESIPPGATTLLLYHTPDLVEDADSLGVDLYLAGHTHGGQVRLPFYGALVTSSRFLKKYESGLYTLDHTILYVSRGIGMEGLSLPRARFFCPPEVVLITLGAEEPPR
jgi:hypothetical protein